jgi:hypothetical protein
MPRCCHFGDVCLRIRSGRCPRAHATAPAQYLKKQADSKTVVTLLKKPHFTFVERTSRSFEVVSKRNLSRIVYYEILKWLLSRLKIRATFCGPWGKIRELQPIRSYQNYWQFQNRRPKWPLQSGRFRGIEQLRPIQLGHRPRGRKHLSPDRQGLR